MSFDNRLVRLLVAYLGLYQVLHLCLNLSYLAGLIAFPPPPAAGAWDTQIRTVFDAMATVDAGIALLSLAFAVAFWQRRPSAALLGTVALTATLPSAVIYNHAMLANGSSLAALLLIDVVYLPLLLLFAVLLGDLRTRTSPAASPGRSSGLGASSGGR